tara:strand:- start:5602 stop:5988 length:387 start_codon:yes stop_codon:yes gene_type:complete
MQTQNIVQSFVAAEAITEYALVSIDGNGKITITDAGTEIGCVGVAQRACSAGETVEVVVHGTTRVIASGALTFATTPLLTGAANGQVAAVSSSDYPVARILPNINQVSTAGAGEQLLVLFTGPSVVKA